MKTEQSGLEAYGFTNPERIHWNLPTPALYEMVVKRGEGHIANEGPAICRTGQHTGRSPNDKFIVEEEGSKSDVFWSKDNKPIQEAKFDKLLEKMGSHVKGRELFVQDCYAGADEDNRIKVRVVTENAWHSLFARNMFITERDPEKLKDFEPDFTVIDLPELQATPAEDGTNSETFIVLNLKKQMVLIGGTSYAGEIKKSIFTVMNYLLPKKDIMSMHCSANVGEKGDVALFFGLSGTGKTTLSADPDRYLIGDDEHGWSDKGTFNIEGGCYAKVINLSKEMEPDIYECTRKFGTVLENVVMDMDDRTIDLDDGSLTENTRASYPISHLPKIVEEGTGEHPQNIIFLTYDAFGVLPPVAKLSLNQAMYHFISGYTARVAGTEKGVTEPKAVFSSCFGAPFMVWHPSVYAKLLGDKISQHGAKCWLVNTGLTGGPYGVGKRFSIKYTRMIINAILNGTLDNTDFSADPAFGFGIPADIKGVPSEILDPSKGWSSKEEYDKMLRKLAGDFKENFKRFEEGTAQEIIDGGPVI